MNNRNRKQAGNNSDGAGRLVVVSNRVSSPKDRTRAGGLAVALLDALKTNGGLWFGWSGNIGDGEGGKLTVEDHGRISLALMDLGQRDYDDYYNGFANRALWPLFHYRLDLTLFDRQHHQSYLRVNHAFARALKPMLHERDTLWVHDYHFLAFGEEMRRMGVSNRLGFFLHIPFPAPEVLVALPSHAQIVRALFAYDLIGFQSDHDLGCFTNYVLQEAGGEKLSDGRLSAFGTSITAKVFPIGIDGRAFARFATSADAQRHGKRVHDLLAGRDQIIGVERLDYTKGIPERFRAFERLLEHYPENRGRVSLMQVAPPSRTEVRAYTEIRQRLESIAGAVNGRFADYDWTPIRYLNRSFNRRALAGLYRASRVGLVTPLRDGMNLVAKEYVAAQDAQDPGVLILSRFAGSAKQMGDALIVNPYDVQDVADALQRGLNMGLEERRKRWQALSRNVFENDVAKWTRDFLATLEETPR